MVVDGAYLYLFFYEVLGRILSNFRCLFFCRSYLDELKASVISDDIEGIVCLTAIMHIILVINKG